MQLHVDFMTSPQGHVDVGHVSFAAILKMLRVCALVGNYVLRVSTCLCGTEMLKFNGCVMRTRMSHISVPDDVEFTSFAIARSTFYIKGPSAY